MFEPSTPGETPCLVYHAPCDHLYTHKRAISLEANYLPCPDCKPEATAPLHEDAKERASRDAASRNHKRGLPSLIGSEKQIRWAEAIRDSKWIQIEMLVGECENEYRRCAGEKNVPAAVHDRWIQATQEVKLLKIRTEARFWIAKRDTPVTQLLGVRWPAGMDR